MQALIPQNHLVPWTPPGSSTEHHVRSSPWTLFCGYKNKCLNIVICLHIQILIIISLSPFYFPIDNISKIHWGEIFCQHNLKNTNILKLPLIQKMFNLSTRWGCSLTGIWESEKLSFFQISFLPHPVFHIMIFIYSKVQMS